MNAQRKPDVRPDLAPDILGCRIVDAQIAMRLSHCPPPPLAAQSLRNTQAMVRACIKRMQEVSAP
jgi:hypothetical protein